MLSRDRLGVEQEVRVQIVDRDRKDAEDPWELRARREKEEFRKERDYHWQIMQTMEHWEMLNHPPEDQTDVRVMEKLYDPIISSFKQCSRMQYATFCCCKPDTC